MSAKPESSRLVGTGARDPADRALRPGRLSEFIGQTANRKNLGTFIQAARQRGEALDHVLLHGPPGLGKTTLAQIIARELDVSLRTTSGPILVRAGDLAAVLTHLKERDVLFIDEIHRLPPAIEEVLYPAMEDFHLDIVLGKGPSARTMRIDVAPFTLVGATTRAGNLSTPLRERFGIPFHVDFYTPEELLRIVQRGASLLDMNLTDEGALEIARRARGTPRVAGRLLRRVRDIVLVAGIEAIDQEEADSALRTLMVDSDGLDPLDRRYLRHLLETYRGGPAGLDTLAAVLVEERDVIRDVVEPYLLQAGFLQRTPLGRVATDLAWKRFGLTPPGTRPGLFDTLGDDGRE